MTSNHEIVGNYEVGASGDVITRRDVLIMGAMAAGGLITSAPAIAAPALGAVAAPAATGPYVAKDFGHLVGKMDGLSASQIEQHIKLYKGYVGKSNELTTKLKDADLEGANATYGPLREMLLEESYATNGVVYHEFYFGNLGGSGGEATGDLKAALEERWGTYGKFMDLLKASGKSMRGWVVVGWNTRGSHLTAYGLDLHNMGARPQVIPVLVLDVYEHAYMVDYGIDRAKYLDAFVKNLDWGVVGKRLAYASKHPGGPDSTV